MALIDLTDKRAGYHLLINGGTIEDYQHPALRGKSRVENVIIAQVDRRQTSEQWPEKLFLSLSLFIRFRKRLTSGSFYPCEKLDSEIDSKVRQ